jgi:hypothetical protein
MSIGAGRGVAGVLDAEPPERCFYGCQGLFKVFVVHELRGWGGSSVEVDTTGGGVVAL